MTIDINDLEQYKKIFGLKTAEIHADANLRVSIEFEEDPTMTPESPLARILQELHTHAYNNRRCWYSNKLTSGLRVSVKIDLPGETEKQRGDVTLVLSRSDVHPSTVEADTVLKYWPYTPPQAYNEPKFGESDRGSKTLTLVWNSPI